MTSLAHSPVNDQRTKDAIAKTRELARTHGAGERSLAVLAGHMVRWAKDGVVDASKDKHGKGIDDAKFFYDAYLEAYSTKADPSTANGKKANASKLRQFILVGSNLNIDAIAEHDRMVEKRKAHASVDAKSVKPEYAAAVDWARAQIAKPDAALTDDEISECVQKAAPGDFDLDEYLEGVQKRIEKLISGEAGGKCQEAPVVAAHDAIRDFRKTLLVAKETATLFAKAAELGYVLNAGGEMERPA